MKIAVLVSGGVDSAVVVHKLYQEGHDLHLFYIRISNDTEGGECSYEEDIEMCRLIAAKYNLPLTEVSLHEEYWQYVMDYALKTVKSGLTPHPDMMCNKIIKFGFFEDRWGKEFDKTATGHYAAIRKGEEGYFLTTANDPVKDQTDFLAQLTQEQLSHLLFPLGDLPKSEVRKIAEEAGLPNARRKDSQGICFLGKINYKDFIQRHLGVIPGDVVEIETGKKIGQHNGYWFYTIGQRKGLGLGGGPWFVIKKDIPKNIIYVSKGYDTPLQYGKKIHLLSPNWITYNPLQDKNKKLKIAFKIRHVPDFNIGTLSYEMNEGENKNDDSISLVLESEQDVQGIAPGQFAVFYTLDKKTCLGSALITL
ncbi:MAG: tRNA 2-thiouridine(34) synthase MnmA [Muribaculaceae bacterium]|nr:tRNA 2-thiouridine(34) synthase MnmA [Muribaculaceae bacterium]